MLRFSFTNVEKHTHWTHAKAGICRSSQVSTIDSQSQVDIGWSTLATLFCKTSHQTKSKTKTALWTGLINIVRTQRSVPGVVGKLWSSISRDLSCSPPSRNTAQRNFLQSSIIQRHAIKRPTQPLLFGLCCRLVCGLFLDKIKDIKLFAAAPENKQ